MQLPFAVIPLIHFTSDRRRMGASPIGWVSALAWGAAADHCRTEPLAGVVNRGRVAESSAEEWRTLILWTLVPFFLLLFALLLWVTFEPWLPVYLQLRERRAPVVLPANVAVDLSVPPYGTFWCRSITPIAIVLRFRMRRRWLRRTERGLTWCMWKRA